MTATPNPAPEQEGHSNKRSHQQAEILFTAQILGLHKLVKGFGGDKLAEKFDLHVLKSANKAHTPLVLNNGKIQELKANLALQTYARIMQESIDFATSVAGKRLVHERIQIVMEGLESLTGKGFHETALRLGLTRSR